MAKMVKPKKEAKKAPKQEPSEDQPVDFGDMIRLAANTKPIKWPKRPKKTD